MNRSCRPSRKCTCRRACAQELNRQRKKRIGSGQEWGIGRAVASKREANPGRFCAATFVWPSRAEEESARARQESPRAEAFETTAPKSHSECGFGKDDRLRKRATVVSTGRNVDYPVFPEASRRRMRLASSSTRSSRSIRRRDVS